jgi:hypothetical protein
MDKFVVLLYLHHMVIKVNFGNNLWVAGGQGTNTLAYSSNGTQWTGLGATIFLILLWCIL